jgi:Yip1-like protein
MANSYLQRLVGAAALDRTIYEEVEADDRATMQACTTVVISSLAAGIGARGFDGIAINFVWTSLVALMAWAAWALVTYGIGVFLLPQRQTESDVGELLRTTGFATAPGCLRILGVLPGVTVPVFAVTAIWMLAAMVVAVRQALDYDNTARAVAVCVVGWALALGMAVLYGSFIGPTVH